MVILIGADIYSVRMLLSKENNMAMIRLDQRDKNITYLNCDNNSPYEQDAL